MNSLIRTRLQALRELLMGRTAGKEPGQGIMLRDDGQSFMNKPISRRDFLIGARDLAIRAKAHQLLPDIEVELMNALKNTPLEAPLTPPDIPPINVDDYIAEMGDQLESMAGGNWVRKSKDLRPETRVDYPNGDYVRTDAVTEPTGATWHSDHEGLGPYADNYIANEHQLADSDQLRVKVFPNARAPHNSRVMLDPGSLPFSNARDSGFMDFDGEKLVADRPYKIDGNNMMDLMLHYGIGLGKNYDARNLVIHNSDPEMSLHNFTPRWLTKGGQYARGRPEGTGLEGRFGQVKYHDIFSGLKLNPGELPELLRGTPDKYGRHLTEALQYSPEFRELLKTPEFADEVFGPYGKKELKNVSGVRFNLDDPIVNKAILEGPDAALDAILRRKK